MWYWVYRLFSPSMCSLHLSSVLHNNIFKLIDYCALFQSPDKGLPILENTMFVPYILADHAFSSNSECLYQISQDVRNIVDQESHTMSTFKVVYIVFISTLAWSRSQHHPKYAECMRWTMYPSPNGETCFCPGTSHVVMQTVNCMPACDPCQVCHHCACCLVCSFVDYNSLSQDHVV